MEVERLEVGLGERSYPIVIGSGILDATGRELAAAGFPQRVAVVTNPRVEGLYLPALRAGLEKAGFEILVVTIGDGEEFKNLGTLDKVFGDLIRGGLDRGCGLVALGGGVVGDLAGFAAATYLRGIPFAQVPTSLLAQVDSSVGGKTGVNHALGKNLIGAFYQPRMVQIDVATLRTLPDREFAAGLAEVVKYGVIRDREFFRWLGDHREAILARDPRALTTMVKRSCQIKADVVEIDEKEGSLRAILNFGHTYGHAVETLAGYGTVRHGEAVAIGMLVAAAAAWEIDLCTGEEVLALRDVLASFALPVEIPAFAPETVLDVIARDKKVKGGKLRLVLNRGLGDCLLYEVADPGPLFEAALERLGRLSG